MRSKRLWLAVPPAAMSLMVGGFASASWSRAREQFPWDTVAVWGERDRPLYTLFVWVLGDPFSLVAATILWIFLFGLLVVRLPERAAKVLTLAVVFGQAAIVAFWLKGFPLLYLGAAAMIVPCWARADAAGHGRSDTWLRRVAVGLVTVLFLECAAGLALHFYGGYRFDRAFAEMEAFLETRLDLDHPRFSRPPPPDGENALRGFIAASEALDLSPEVRKDLGLTENLPLHAWPPWQASRDDKPPPSQTEGEPPATSEEERPPIAMAERMRLVIAKNRRGLELLHQAAERECPSHGLSYRSGREPVMPDLMIPLMGAKLLSAEARLAFAEGDEVGGLRAARTLARLGRCLDEERDLISHLISIPIERGLYQLVLEAASGPEPWAARPSLLSGLAALLPAGDRSARNEESLLLDALESSLAARYAWRTVPWRSASPVPVFVLGPLEGSKILTDQRQVIELARRPIGKFDQEWRLPLGGFVETKAGGYSFVIRRQLVATLEQLAQAALALRRLGLADGKYPRQRPNSPELTRKEPAAGRLITYRPLEDGSLRLEAEGAAELLKRSSFLWHHGRNGYVFRVTLPPPVAPSRPGQQGGGQTSPSILHLFSPH